MSCRRATDVLFDGVALCVILSALWLLSQLPGCHHALRADEPHHAARIQPFARLAWQFVPPECRVINGRQVTIPGHWHQRGAACPTCGDHTRAAAGPCWPPPQPAAIPGKTIPAAAPNHSTTPAATLPATDPSPWRAGFSELLARLDQLDAERRKDVAAIDAAVANRFSDHAAAIEGLAELVAALQSRLEVTPPIQASAAADAGSIGDQSSVASSFWQWLGTDTLTTAAVGAAAAGTGFGVPWLIARAVSTGLILRRQRRRVSRQSIDPPRDPVVIDSPPPPQLRETDVHFVPYETDRLSKAHAWAKEQLGRKYPATIPQLEAFESLVKQYMSGQKRADS